MTVAFRPRTQLCYELAQRLHRELWARAWPPGTRAMRAHALDATAMAASAIAHAEAGGDRVERYHTALAGLATARTAVETALDADPVLLALLARCARGLEEELCGPSTRGWWRSLFTDPHATSTTSPRSLH